jgi:hypothetical protein
MKNINKYITVKIPLLTVIFGSIFLTKCVEPYEPEIKSFENLYVIDGLLTEDIGNSYVKISKTYKYSETRDSLKIITDADVSIIDEFGNISKLNYNGYDRYVFLTKTKSIIPGQKCKLRVVTSEGDTLESDTETMPVPVPIDNLYYTFNNPAQKIGININIDTYDPNKKIKYYSWEFTETWEFSVPYYSPYALDCNMCFKYNSPPKFLIESAVNYPDDNINEFPITFIDSSSNRLRVKYSILVKQYTLTEKTYQFLKDLKSSNEGAGTLFDRVPTSLFGNMKNISNENIPVLGNFQVSGISEKRIFIYYREIMDYMRVPTGFEYCRLEFLDQRSARLDSLIGAGWIVMDSLISETDTSVGVVNRKSCYDCRRSGTLVEPDFWNDGK